MAVGEGVARDNTEDWLLPAAARPCSFAELESRVDLAVSVARASEGAVAKLGATAIEAAERARQAVDLAARAVAAAQAAAAGATPAPRAAEPVSPGGREEEWLLRFTHRAERLAARLVRIQQV